MAKSPVSPLGSRKLPRTSEVVAASTSSSDERRDSDHGKYLEPTREMAECSLKDLIPGMLVYLLTLSMIIEDIGGNPDDRYFMANSVSEPRIKA